MTPPPLACILAAAACACSSSSPSSSSSPERDRPAMTATPSRSAPSTWTAPSQGLRIQLELPASAPAGAVQARLSFRNETSRPMRLLFVRPEVFRLFNSTFRVWDHDKVVSLQPDPHPHGYLLDENDFLLLPAGGTRTVTQSLQLPNPGSFEVEWMYENKQRSFPGGIQTLDGPTRPLFGGSDVEDLWIGSLSTRRPIRVDPK